jgi:hypothetical protein
MHEMPAQQPFGHDVELHTQPPPVRLHVCPVPQAAHPAPPVPHEPFDCDEGASHVLPLQQPAGHELALHTHWPVVVSHTWPLPHALHVAPPAPHEPLFSFASASHPVPLQQPAHVPPPQLH